MNYLLMNNISQFGDSFRLLGIIILFRFYFKMINNIYKNVL